MWATSRSLGGRRSEGHREKSHRVDRARMRPKSRTCRHGIVMGRMHARPRRSCGQPRFLFGGQMPVQILGHRDQNASGPRGAYRSLTSRPRGLDTRIHISVFSFHKETSTGAQEQGAGKNTRRVLAASTVSLRHLYRLIRSSTRAICSKRSRVVFNKQECMRKRHVWACSRVAGC